MCEANAYLYMEDGSEELLLEDVDVMCPDEDKIYLRSITGEQKWISANIKEVSLVNHKIVLKQK